MNSFWGQIKEYLFLKKQDGSKPKNINIKLMHSMNRISIILFLTAAVIIIYRLIK